VSQVHRIVLFDPGDTGDFAKPSGWSALIGGQTCDWQIPIPQLLAKWLQSDASNRLFVLTGAASEEKQNGRSTYAGLWKYYFPAIWDQPFAGRAVVCDYDNMAHETVLTTGYGMVESNSDSCPTGPNLTQWNP
jgi:hypothetical protein